VANPAQNTTNDLKLVPKPVESGDSNCTTIMHNNKMPPAGGDNGVANSGPLNEMPPDGYLLAKEPGAGGAPPDCAYLERLANKDQVNTTEDAAHLGVIGVCTPRPHTSGGRWPSFFGSQGTPRPHTSRVRVRVRLLASPLLPLCCTLLVAAAAMSIAPAASADELPTTHLWLGLGLGLGL